jgi:hypothetical protein
MFRCYLDASVTLVSVQAFLSSTKQKGRGYKPAFVGTDRRPKTMAIDRREPLMQATQSGHLRAPIAHLGKASGDCND